LEKLDSSQTLRELFERALTIMLDKLNPERAFIAYKEKDSQELLPQGTHGIDPQSMFVTGEISMEVIKQVLRDGKPINLVDAIQHPGYANRTSVILSGLRSILCVPIKHPSGLIVGLVYADNRLKAGAFDQSHVDWVCELMARVESRLVPVLRTAPGEAAAAPATAHNQEALEQEWKHHRAEGIRLFQAGQPEVAEEHLFKAQALAEQFGPWDYRLAKSLGEVAELFRHKKELDKAERALIRSIEIFEKHRDHHHQDLAPSLNNLAGLYYSQGNGLRAEGLYKRALEIWKETLSADDRKLAPVLYNLGTICRAANKYEEAAQYFSRALQIAEKAWGAEHPHTARCRDSFEEARKLASNPA